MSKSSHNDLEFMTLPQQDDEAAYAMSSPQVGDMSAEEGGGGIGGALSTVMGSTLFRHSKHPMAALFHLLFKALALFFYIFGGWFVSGFSLVFITCIVLLACDFWTVKNVSGRLLVGLRWWSYTREDGSEEWVFESLEDMAEVSSLDSSVFWGALYLTPVVWSLLLVVGLLRLKIEYLPIVLAAIFMSFANILGYTKCSNSAKARMKTFMERGHRMASMESGFMRSWIMTSLINATVGGGGTATSPSSSSMDAPRSATV